MMRLILSYLCFLHVFIHVKALQCVSNKNDLIARLKAASSGDTICIANGNYNDWEMILNKDDITLQGETGGEVVLQGDSTIMLKGSRIVVKNFKFTAPLSEGNSRRIRSPIVFGYESKYCNVSDCMIYDHAADVWVKVRGNNNQVHHCTFKDKPAPELSDTGKELRLSNIVSVSDSKMFKNQIHHNKFINYDPGAIEAEHKHGSAEAIYVKIALDAGRQTRNLGCIVNNNYFFKIDSEEETIGIKSSGNEVFENAIEDCYGGISLRHGRNNIVRNNYIKARSVENKLDYGISVHDENHVVQDNWVMDVGQFHGIKVVGGNGPFDCNACHVRAKNIKIIRNTLIRSTLHLGKRFHEGTYHSPEDIKIENIKVSSAKNYAMITGYDLDGEKSDVFKGNPYTFAGVNEFFGKKIAYTNVKNNLQPLINSKAIKWNQSYEDLGDYGLKIIRKIECYAGTSWEERKATCLTL